MKTKSDIFLIFAQNIGRGYTLEPPHLALIACLWQHAWSNFETVVPRKTLNFGDAE